MIGTLLFGSVTLLFTSYILNIGIPIGNLQDGVLLAVQVSLVLGVLNLTLKPFLKIITIPFHILSFGLFSFVVNGFIVLLASKIIHDFHIPSLLQGIYFAFIFTFIMRGYHLLVRDED